jgi:hypothetical protein
MIFHKELAKRAKPRAHIRRKEDIRILPIANQKLGILHQGKAPFQLNLHMTNLHAIHHKFQREVPKVVC